MQLGLGCKPDGAPSNIRELVMQHLDKAATDIAGPGKETGEFHPGFLHEWNDLSEVYGENLPKLREVKKAYDPEDRFNKGVDFARVRVTPGMTV